MEIVTSLVILSLIVAAYWALVVLPKQQSFKKHQKYIRRLQVGDTIVTYGGLIGTITALDADSGEATIRLADDVEVRIITAAIIQPYNPAELAKNARIVSVETYETDIRDV